MDYNKVYRTSRLSEMNIGLTSKIIKIINKAEDVAQNIKENADTDSDIYKKADDLLKLIDGVEF
jgi:hypothetical protein